MTICAAIHTIVSSKYVNKERLITPILMGQNSQSVAEKVVLTVGLVEFRFTRHI